MDRLFDVPIRNKRFRERSAGIYKHLEDVVRTKKFGDIPATSHEVAHHVWDSDGIRSKLPKAVRDELAKMDYEPDKARPDEGFGEFVRKYLTEDAVQKDAPKTYKWFTEDFLPTSRFADAFAQAKSMIDAYRYAGPIARVQSQIDMGTGAMKKLGNILVHPVDSVRAFWRKIILPAFVNRQQALWDAQFAITGTNIKTRESVPIEYQFATQAKVLTMIAGTRARQAALNGMIDWTGVRVGPSLQEGLAPIAKEISTPRGLLDFQSYMYARHAIDVHAQGKNPGIDLQDAKDVVKAFGARLGWEEAAQAVTKWHDGLLDFLMDAGGLSLDAKAKMRAMYPNYTPLLRSFPKQIMSGDGGRRLANLPPGVRGLKGSPRPILPPLESSIVYAERIFALADKIRVGRSLVDAAEQYGGMGRFVEEVPPDLVPHSTKLENVKSQLEKAGIDLGDADLNATITMFENAYRGSSKDNVIVLWRDGKQKMYQVSPEIYKAVVGLDQQFQLPKVLEWVFGKPTKMVRLAATGIRPGFSAITNPLRDTFTSMVQGSGRVRDLWRVPFENVAGVVKDVLGKELANVYESGGGSMSQPLGVDRSFTKEALSEVLSVSPKDKALNWSKHPIESLRELFSFTEKGPRMAEFERTVRRLGWDEGKELTPEQYIEGQFRAANVSTDYREGGWLSMWLNRLVPFFNAKLQGTNRMAQAFREKPTATLLKSITAITIPSIALWWMNKDKEWYKKMSPSEKARYWHVQIPFTETVIRIPKPFEFGFTFGTMVEGSIDSSYQKDPKPVMEAAEQTIKGFVPSAEDILPPTIKVPGETWANWDLFRDRPIVSHGLERLSPRDQYDPSTTELAKGIGDIFNISPAKIDHVISGFTANMGNEALRGAEDAAGWVGIIDPKTRPPNSMSDMPVLGRLFMREDATRTLDDFYKEFGRLSGNRASAKASGKFLSAADEQKWLAMNAATRLLSDIRNQVRTVIANRSATNSEKRARLKKLFNLTEAIALHAMKSNWPPSPRPSIAPESSFTPPPR